MPVPVNITPPRCGARGPRDSTAPRWSEIGQPDVVLEGSDEFHQPSRASRSGRSRSTTPPASRPIAPPPLSLPIPSVHSPSSSFASEVEELNAQRQSVKFEADRLEWHENQLRQLARGQADEKLKELRLKYDNVRAKNVVLEAELQKMESVVASHEGLQPGETSKSKRDHASKAEEENWVVGRLEQLLTEKQQLARQCEDVQAENDSLKQIVGKLLPKCVVLEVELQLLLRKHSGYRQDNGGTTHSCKTLTAVPELHASLPAGGGCQEQQLQSEQQLQQRSQPQLQQLQQQARGVKKLCFVESVESAQEYQKPLARWMPAADTAGDGPSGAAGQIHRSYADSLAANYNKLVDMLEEYKEAST